MNAKTITCYFGKRMLTWYHCHTPRFKDKANALGIKKWQPKPRKFLRHFSIIPWLASLYTISWIARKMQWHKHADPSWNFMRHPVDSAEWRSIKCKWPEFINEGCNIWLGIASDGFNSNGIPSNSYSCWPVYFLITYLLRYAWNHNFKC